MPNWSSTEEITLDAAVFTKLMHALAGVYFWEFAISLDFDWDFISRQKKFQWPMIFYFLDRYLLFFAMIGILIALDVTTEINCQALYTFNQLIGNAAVGLASINLAIRTIALWGQNIYIIVPIVIIIMGHWALILEGILLKAAWVPEAGCVILETNTTVLAATFIYSMCFDLVVLILTATKLAMPRGSRSQLMKMLFKDGLIYFVIAFVANLIATVFMLLNLNPIMSVIFNVPAAIASTIVACRAVRRLTKWSNQGPEVFNHSLSSRSGGLVFRTAASNPPTIVSPNKRQSGVHVQMDTFAVTETGELDLERKSTEHEEHKSDYDLNTEDPEISGDFKRPPY